MDIDLEVINCLNDIIAVVEKKEKVRLYNKKYREKNREKLLLGNKQYNEKNRDKRKEWRDQNKDKIKQYKQSPEGMKSRRLSDWKRRGIIVEDWDGLYYRYLSTAWCDACKVKLTYDKNRTSTTKVVDHCHITGEFRNILCHSCNVKRK